MRLSNLFKSKEKFSNRKPATKTEQNLIAELGLSFQIFHELFGEIILSEIIPRTRFITGKYTEPASGIIFYGLRINPQKTLEHQKFFDDFDLNFEMSYNVLSDRWQEFNHEMYTGKTDLIKLKKDYFKIYPKKDQIDFFEQLNNYQDDKSVERKIVERWVKDYDARLIWADGNTNLFLIPLAFNRKTAIDIFDDMLMLECASSEKEAIEEGWQTKEQFVDEYFKRLPIISLSFYDH